MTRNPKRPNRRRVTNEMIRQKAQEFRRYYGCDLRRGRPRNPRQALIPRLMEFYNLSRSVVKRALSGLPRSGRKKSKQHGGAPAKSDAVGNALAAAFAERAKLISGNQSGQRANANLIGPEHVDRIRGPGLTDPAAERSAIREVLIDALGAYVSVNRTDDSQVTMDVKRLLAKMSG